MQLTCNLPTHSPSQPLKQSTEARESCHPNMLLGVSTACRKQQSIKLATCFMSWLCMSSRKAACGLAKAGHRLTRPGSPCGLGTCCCRQKGHDTQCLAPDFLQVVDQAVDIGCMRMGVCPLPSALDLLLTSDSPVEAWQRCGYAPLEFESQNKGWGENMPLIQVRKP
jgi:hypothetical protein